MTMKRREFLASGSAIAAQAIHHAFATLPIADNPAELCFAQEPTLSFTKTRNVIPSRRRRIATS
jgi:hypothetical protein